MEYNALDVSRYIIHEYNMKETEITNLKLQKILYFIQGMSYIQFGEQLFVEDIEAWQYGPVVPNVYDNYSHNGSLPLFIDNFNSDLFDEDALNIINIGIMSTLKLDPWYLVDLTHQSGTPWRNYYKNGSKELIPKNIIQRYFTEEILNA